MSDAEYEFGDLPVEGIRPGTTILLSGPMHAGTRELGMQLLAGPSEEGAVVISTNQRAKRIAADCERIGIELAADRVAILDCVGDADADISARVLPVSGPADLTGVGMRYSDVNREFHRSGLDRVRTGLFSVSTLLSFGDLRTVSRFVHTLAGRVDSVDGLGVLVIDPTIHDDQITSTLGQFCAGRIEVRERDGSPELRVRGLPDQPRDWMPMNLSPG